MIEIRGYRATDKDAPAARRFLVLAATRGACVTFYGATLKGARDEAESFIERERAKAKADGVHGTAGGRARRIHPLVQEQP